MGCNQRCCIKAKVGDHNFQYGIPGCEIALICDSPTGASEELGIPLVGRTGTNVCRVFKRLIDDYDWDKVKTCLRMVTICNASPHKGEDAGLTGQDYIADLINENPVHICVGFAAIDLYTDIKDRFSEKVVIELPHLGDRGLSRLSQFRPATCERKLDAIAKWIDQCRKKGGFHDFSEFVSFYKQEV